MISMSNSMKCAEVKDADEWLIVENDFEKLGWPSLAIRWHSRPPMLAASGPNIQEEMNSCECGYPDRSLHYILYECTRFSWARDQCSRTFN